MRQEQTKDVIAINAGGFRGRLVSLLTATRRKSLVTSVISLALITGALQAQERCDLSSLSVGDLMNVEVPVQHAVNGKITWRS